MLAKSTIDFLKDLKDNNNRDWFTANKKRYEAASKDFKVFVEKLLAGIASFDGSMKMATAKDCIFRINRDVRFSADKSPYKTAFGANMAPGGRKDTTSGYYLHLEPGKSFIAGGCYMPPSDLVEKIRKEIAWNYNDFKKILENKEFKKVYGQLEGEKLKRPPKGFDPDHPAIEILKHKSFIVSHEMPITKLTKAGAEEEILNLCRVLLPLNTFMRQTAK
jgi:uncharacterized protein (TIGR02453 family)